MRGSPSGPLVLLGLLIASRVGARDIAVTTFDDTLVGPGCSLRGAVIAASDDVPVGGCVAGEPGRDRIELPAGTYVLALGGEDEDAGLTGDLDVGGPLEIVGAAREVTVVQWGGISGDRLLDVKVGAELELSGVTLRLGRTGGRGGLVRVDGMARLRDCGLFEGEAAFGGGLGLGPRGSLLIERCEISRNAGDGGGLGAGIASSAVVRDSWIHHNRALRQGGGGILAASAELVIEDSEIADNTADDSRWGGGGLLVLGGSLTVRRSTVALNSASDANADGSRLDPRFDESGGGGLALRGARVEIENSTISGNRADEARLGGGGLLAVFSDVRIAHATLASNKSASSGAEPAGGSLARWDGVGGPRALRLEHSLVSSLGRECFATAPVSGVVNLIGDTSCGDEAGGLGPVTGLDPVLADNGGPTRTHRLLPASNAIDAGPTRCVGAAGAALGFGQRGVVRAQNGACDLGSIERSNEAFPVIAAAASPAVLSAPGGPLELEIILGNGGPLPIDVTSLSSPQLGNLAGLGSCQLPRRIDTGTVGGCLVTVDFVGTPGFHVIEIVAAAQDRDGALGFASAEIELVLTEAAGPVLLAARMDPAVFEEPGGAGTVRLRVDNTSVGSVELVELWDDEMGSLVDQGSCATGVVLEPSESYECSYPVVVTGQAGEVVLRHVVAQVSTTAATFTLGADIAFAVLPPGAIVFGDGFETGDVGAWSAAEPVGAQP